MHRSSPSNSTLCDASPRPIASARAIVMQFGRADVHAQAAQDAEARFEHHVVEATKAAQRLQPGVVGVVADLDLGEADPARTRRRWDGLALDGVVARGQPAKGGPPVQLDVHAARRSGGHAGELGVDGGRRPLPVGHRVDEVARTVRDVATGPDAGVRGPQGDRIDLDAAAAQLQLDAREHLEVGGLTDSEDDRVRGEHGVACQGRRSG